MSNTTRLPSHLRAASISGGANSANGPASAAPPSLAARIAEKRAELDNLKELRDLSGQLANQMETLEQKLSTLSSGTEAVAMVLSNWGAVLKSINMASIKLPKPKDSEEQHETAVGQFSTDDPPLPHTLVRIPVQESARGTVSHAAG